MRKAAATCSLICRGITRRSSGLSRGARPRAREGVAKNKPRARDRGYAHITTLRCDLVNPPLLGMAKVVSEDAVRRALSKIEAEAGRSWLQEQLDYCTRREGAAEGMRRASRNRVEPGLR